MDDIEDQAELAALTRSAVESARQGRPDDVRDLIQQIAERTRSQGRERMALSRFVALARGCVCRGNDQCLHVEQALRLTEYLATRPPGRQELAAS